VSVDCAARARAVPRRNPSLREIDGRRFVDAKEVRRELEACAREQRGRERGEMRTEMFVASRQQHTIPLYTAAVRRQFGSRRVTIELSIVLDQE
jgi:hypothetical protein